MKQLINTYLNGTLGQIIYAGVGKASTLEWLLALDFKSLTLIEPIEITAKRRKKRYSGEKVEVIHAALSSATGTADFTVMQPEKYSSLKPEINLRHILKNSQVKVVQPIKTIALSDVIEQTRLSKDENNVLILNVNGLERECLKSTAVETITQFSTLIVQIETQGIYTQDSHIDRQLKALLKPLGFYFEDIKQENTIFTNLVFKRDDAALTQITKLQNELHRLANVNQELKAQFDQVSAERESLTVSLNASQQALKDSKVKLTQQQSEADKQKAELSGQVAEAATKAKQLEAQLVERTQQCDEQNNQQQEYKKRSENIKVQLDQVVEERESLKASLNSKQEILTELQNKLTQQQEEADKRQVKLSTQISDTGTKTKQLEAQLAERSQQRDEQSRQRRELKAHAESLKAQLEKVQSEHGNAIAEKTDKLEETQVALEEKETQLNNLQAELEKQKAEHTAVQMALTDAQKALGESQARLSNKQDELGEYIQQRDEQIEQYQNHKQWAESLKAQLEQAQLNFEEESKELKADLKEVKRSASLGQKMLAKAQIDLDNLREKYAVKVTSEQELISLVKELKEKLTLASKYYFQLQKEHPELLASQSNTEVL